VPREYSNESQERGYKVLMLLAGNEFNGLAPGEIAKALNISAGNVTRDLRVLQKVGLAEPVPHDENKWRLGPRVIQMAIAFKHNISTVQHRLAEVEQRYSRDY
jgi:DNA-binding IclR family transcriptional regulator